MLIILSGLEAIAKPKIANAIIRKLNEPFLVEGLEVKYNPNFDEILYQEGNNITFPDVVTTETFDHIRTALNDKHRELDDLSEEYNVKDFFIDIGYDFGILETKEYTLLQNEETVTKSFDDILTAYNSSSLSNFVISGIVSNAFIEDITTAIGAENVSVINITRNPSASYFMHSPDTSYQGNDDREKMFSSMLNAIKLKQLGYTTVKFEDIISTQSITVNGTTIPLPDTFASSNGVINVWESENLPSKTADEVLNFNSSISPLDATLVGAPDNSSIYDNFKLDIFAELSYTALTYAEITATPS